MASKDNQTKKAGPQEQNLETGNENKYLTDIKELPPENKEEKKNPQVQPQKETKKIAPEVKAALVPKEPVENESISEEEEVGGTKNFPLSAKDVILGIINLVSIILLIIILVRLPEKAKELKDLKSEKILSEANISYEFLEIEEAKERIVTLEALFLDEPGVVNFVSEVEKLKTEGSVIQKVTFVSQKIVKDKTGNYGIPIVIELVGNWEAIAADLEKIDGLPFLFRPIRVEAEKSLKEDEAGGIVYKNGGFLYVKDELGKD